MTIIVTSAKNNVVLKKINFNNRYEFIALSKNKDLYENSKLTEKEVKTYMVGWLTEKFTRVTTCTLD